MIRILWEIEDYESDINPVFQKTLSDIIEYAMETEHLIPESRIAVQSLQDVQVQEQTLETSVQIPHRSRLLAEILKQLHFMPYGLREVHSMK